MNMRYWVVVFVAIAVNPAFASDILTNTRYNALKANFLNINPAYFTEIDIAGMDSTEMAAFLGGKDTDSPLLLIEKTGGIKGNQHIYGANYACTNSYSENAACWYNTGGTEGISYNPSDNIDNHCGDFTGDNITEAMTNASLLCSTPDTPWSAYRFWLGTGNSTQYLVQQFPGGDDIPVNRFCAEIEFPSVANLDLAYSDTRSDIFAKPYLSQLVNPLDAGAHLREIMFEWGSYTATKTTLAGTTMDEEFGDLYQQGGSHWYHKPTFSNRAPADRIYAISSNVLVACMGDIPTGVRSGMGDSYAASPFLTLGGSGPGGITNAANYLNYITRVYWQVELDENSIANYPLQIKINKIWAMYEENEILAVNSDGGTLGVDMVEAGDTAFYPFTLLNDADEERTYRVLMTSGQNTVYKDVSDTDEADRIFKIYIDANNNQVLDSGELASALVPNETITIAANTDVSFIMEHQPNFAAFNDNKLLWGKRYYHASVSFIEDGRLRSAGYAVRTWEGDVAAIESKEQFFEDSKYPSATSKWVEFADFNLAKNVETNPHLLRNTPDFKNLFTQVNYTYTVPNTEWTIIHDGLTVLCSSRRPNKMCKLPIGTVYSVLRIPQTGNWSRKHLACISGGCSEFNGRGAAMAHLQ